MVSSEALTAPEAATDSSDGLTIACGAAGRDVRGGTHRTADHLAHGPDRRAQPLPLGEPAGEVVQHRGAHGQAAAAAARAHVVKNQRQPAPVALRRDDRVLEVVQGP